MAKKIEDLDISMERGEQIGDGYKYLILAEFKERQRMQNALVSEAMNKPDQPEAPEAPSHPASPATNAGGNSGNYSKLCNALAESKGTDWLLALIAFLLFCILISK